MIDYDFRERPKSKELFDATQKAHAKLDLKIDDLKKESHKATGPKTEAGKKKVSQNAVKHGLYAKNIIIDSPHLKEDPEEYELLYSSMMADLKPVGAFQEKLVLKLINSLWRCQRLILAENAAINEQLGPRPIEAIGKMFDPQKVVPPVSDDPQRFNYNKSQCIPRGGISDSFVRYERHLDLQIWRTFKMLRSLQYQNQINHPKAPPTPLPKSAETNSPPPAPGPKNAASTTPNPPHNPASNNIPPIKSPYFNSSPSQNPTIRCASVSFPNSP